MTVADEDFCFVHRTTCCADRLDMSIKSIVDAAKLYTDVRYRKEADNLSEQLKDLKPDSMNCQRFNAKQLDAP
jgi:hypothetical protein